MNVLLLEDEPAVAEELRRMLLRIRPKACVLAVLDEVAAAREWLGAHPAPDLILSDIQLADGLSFDAFAKVPIAAPIIFCTAFDQYAVRAFELNGVDYLLKPVDPARLEQALAKIERLSAFFSVHSEEYGRRLDAAMRSARDRPRSTLLVPGHGKLIPLPVEGIGWIRSSAGLTVAFACGRRYMLEETLDQLEACLDPVSFRRANRQFLVARSAIAEVRPLTARKLEVRLNCEVPETVVVSKAGAVEFMHWLREDERG